MKIRAIGMATFVLFLTMGLFTGVAGAEDMGKKLCRGTINTTTGWAELPYQVVHQSSDDPYKGMTYGFMDGLSKGLQRTMYGVWDSVTFMVPPYHEPAMEPETLFGDAP